MQKFKQDGAAFMPVRPPRPSKKFKYNDNKRYLQERGCVKILRWQMAGQRTSYDDLGCQILPWGLSFRSLNVEAGGDEAVIFYVHLKLVHYRIVLKTKAGVD